MIKNYNFLHWDELNTISLNYILMNDKEQNLKLKMIDEQYLKRDTCAEAKRVYGLFTLDTRPTKHGLWII